MRDIENCGNGCTKPHSLTCPDQNPSLLGLKLEPLEEAVASLPTEIGKYISNFAKEMLSIKISKKQKEKALEKLHSGTKAQPYPPSSLCSHLLVKASEHCQYDENIKQILEEVEQVHQYYIKSMSNCCLSIAKEEIWLHLDNLHNKLFTAPLRLGDNLKIMAKINKSSEGNERVTTCEIATLATHDLFADQLSNEDYHHLQQSRTLERDKLIQTLQLTSLPALSSKANADDHQLATQISKHMLDLLPKITYGLWKWHSQKEQRSCSINNWKS